MKKIYIALAVLFVLLVCLMVIYRIENPPLDTPKTEYTEEKAELLLHNYLQQAEENGEEPLGQAADRGVIYAVMIERSYYGKDGIEAAAGFVFCDHYGKCTTMFSDKTESETKESSEEAKNAADRAKEYFDETYKKAKKSDYEVPAEGEIKIYIRAGDGVYYKIYKESEIPEGLPNAF